MYLVYLMYLQCRSSHTEVPLMSEKGAGAPLRARALPKWDFYTDTDFSKRILFMYLKCLWTQKKGWERERSSIYWLFCHMTGRASQG